MALRKKLGKHWYYFDVQYHNKQRAYNRAATLREAGNKARIIKVDDLTWEVWSS